MFYIGTERVLMLKLEEIGVLKPRGLHCMLESAVLLIVILISLISKDRREKGLKVRSHLPLFGKNCGQSPVILIGIHAIENFA